MDETRARLCLIAAPGIGPVSFYRILQRYHGSAAAAVLDSQSLLNAGIITQNVHLFLRDQALSVIEDSLSWCEQAGRHLIFFDDAEYPAQLLEIAGAPPILYAVGSTQRLNRTQLAIVGSRNPSIQGEETAKQFGRALSRQGVVITSGLALGIDAAAHRGALDGSAKTVAVLGSGLARIYPKSHTGLAREIIDQGGCLISEFAPNTQPTRDNFPRRNRLISGLSLGVLVVEAARQSGSLITARYAIEQNREVFAIPGSIHNPKIRGCHQLIREGAKLVETVADIMDEIPSLAVPAPIAPLPLEVDNLSIPPHLEEEQKNILQLMEFEPIEIDWLIERSGLTAERVSSILLVLELHGLVTPQAGGRYLRVLKEDEKA
ncbi:MAG: DNA-processing protein DprA [Gammaproteobacteria bacterium]|nr:DNA-processing protein DprA [Gammaproteobacteria bacterium]MDH5727533.1 DNA-processing protein DprA [Gammaproteobacteria bacterium]